jgi:hypothetical protein
MFRKRKVKSQITIFLLVGIMLVFIVIFVFSLIYSISKEKITSQQETISTTNNKAEVLRTLVEQCLEDVGENALITIGYRGGRDSLGTPFLQTNTMSINYGYYLGEGNNPSLKEMQTSLKILLENNIESCVISSLENRGENFFFYGALISLETPEVDVEITEDSTIFMLHLPIKLSMGDIEKKLENFSPIEIPVRLKDMNAISTSIVKQLTINPYFIDAFYLLDQTFSFDISFITPDTYIFLITDNQTKIDNEPYQFLFATKIKVPEDE